jgi:F0F1-type ATP synthase assembly protein I
MLVPIFLCSFAGLYIDRKFGTVYWFVLLFFVGALAGFRNVYILAKKIYEKSDDEG